MLDEIIDSSDLNDAIAESNKGINSERISEDNINSDFPLLMRVDSKPLVLKILSYLSAIDLSKAGMISVFFWRIIHTPLLWKSLILSDYLLERGEFEMVKSAPNEMTSSSIDKNCFTISSNNTNINFKLFYINRALEVKSRTISEKLYVSMKRDEVIQDQRMQYVEVFLDIYLVRLFGPLFFIGLFTTLLLYALRGDGHHISSWACMSPILYCVLHFIFAIFLTWLVHRHRHSTSQSVRNLWTNISSPFKELLDSDSDSVRHTLKLIAPVVVVLLQLLLLATKLSYSIQGGTEDSDLSWGVVFLPSWVLLFLYLCLPFSGLITDDNSVVPYILGLLLAWIPFFVIMICITVKLEALENNNNHEEAGMKLELVFIPLWAMESVVVLGSLLSVVDTVVKYRRGLLGRVSDRIGKC